MRDPINIQVVDYIDCSELPLTLIEDEKLFNYNNNKGFLVANITIYSQTLLLQTTQDQPIFVITGLRYNRSNFCSKMTIWI